MEVVEEDPAKAELQLQGLVAAAVEEHPLLADYPDHLDEGYSVASLPLPSDFCVRSPRDLFCAALKTSSPKLM